MNLFRIITILIISTLSNVSLIAQETIINGVILNKSDSNKIAHAHIINITSKTGVTSNDNGYFSIQTNPDDTLLISYIGYRSIAIKASELTTNTYLEETTYNIDSYTVLPYKNFQEFKEAFVNLELKDTVKHKINPSIMASVKPYDPTNLDIGLSIRKTFNGPISGLLAKFNKRIKDKINYEKLLARDRRQVFLDKKFNPDLIKRITILKDSSIVNDFMKYCDFTDQFIEFSSDYYLVDQIINCFEEYNNLTMVNK